MHVAHNHRAKPRPSRARRAITNPELEAPERKTPWRLFVDSSRLDDDLRRKLRDVRSMALAWRSTIDPLTLAAFLTECVGVDRATVVRCAIDLIDSARELLTHPAADAARRGLSEFLRDSAPDVRALAEGLQVARESNSIDGPAGFDIAGEALSIIEADEPAAALESLIQLVCDVSPWHAFHALKCFRSHWSDRFAAGQDPIALYVQARTRRLAAQCVDEQEFAAELRDVARWAGLAAQETAVEAYPTWLLVGDDGRDCCSVALVAGVAYTVPAPKPSSRQHQTNAGAE